MEIIELELSYGKIKIYNLKSSWIQPKTMSPGYMLCYDDDKYDRGIIYKSQNKQLLLKKQDFVVWIMLQKIFITLRNI